MKKYVLKGPAGAPYRVDYEKELNPQQLDVVMAGEGPILVIAGAGSGKTRTVTYRVARLIESGAAPGQILLLTFTNKAAREMLRRVEGLLQSETRRIVGGTFHHVANLVLRRHARRLELEPSFTILDREDSSDLMGDLASRTKSEFEEKRFPKGDVLLEINSYSQNTGIPVSRLVSQRYPMFSDIEHSISQICRRYAARKRELNMVDFDDLLVFWHELLRKHEDVREEQRRVWRHVLVDEYQDTNKLQSDIVEAITGESGNLMVVGDDSQSIYSFRGANFGNIIDFPKRHPGAQVYKLEVNYRSTPDILDLANSSIRHNSRQFEKQLQAVRAAGGKPEVVVVGDPNEQALFIVQRMLELRDENLDFRDMAVLYRAHYHSMELQLELTRQKIPFQVRSGMRFFEQAHIKDVVSYLKVAINGKDELAWKRILKLVPRIGKATCEKAWALIERDAVGEVKKALPKAAQKGWEDLVLLLGRLRTLFKTPAEMIRAVLDGGYESHLQTQYANYSVRGDDLRRLADYALRYDAVETLLSELALTSGIAGQDALEETGEEDSVILSTVHQAKGLEWKAVFIPWLVEGKFPDGRAVKEDFGEEEERRLFYVAATRARDRLYLVHPTLADERFLMGVIQRPSRFVKELDPGTYEEATVSLGPEPF